MDNSKANTAKVLGNHSIEYHSGLYNTGRENDQSGLELGTDDTGLVVPVVDDDGDDVVVVLGAESCCWIVPASQDG